MGLLRLTKSVKHFIPYKQFQTQSIISPIIGESMNEMLQVNGLRCIPVVGDGNCIFNAMDVNIQSDKSRWFHALLLTGITWEANLSISDISAKLRLLKNF